MLPYDKCKIIKLVIAKQLLLKNAEIFEKAEIEGIKKENTCKILGELGSAKKKKRKIQGNLLSKMQIFLYIKLCPRNT